MREADWDDEKNETNYRKHGVRFEYAEKVLHDPLFASIDDVAHSHSEERFIGIGQIGRDIIVIGYTITDGKPRIYTARNATQAERRRYMRGDMIHDSAVDIDDDIPAEVDFTNAVVGRHYIPKWIVRVSIDADVAKHYANSESVNDALRMLIAEGRAPAPRNE